MAITQPMTLAEFLQLPEVKPYRELIHGVVSPKMSPSGPHAALQVRIVKQIDGTGPPGHELRVFTEMRIILGDETYVPDLVAYREDRVPITGDGEVSHYFYEPPDLAVEIASPGQTLSSLITRCRDLVSLGVPFVLLLVPHPQGNRTARVFRPDAEIGPLTGADVVDLSDLAAGLRFTVDEIFSALRGRRDRR